MKSVLMSIKPQWCELIASGEKTIEVRKTKPKLETPFKVYIYCTSNKQGAKDLLEIHGTDGKFRKANDKVIGEFVCDEILQFNQEDYNSPAYDISDDDLNRACLFQEDLYEYGNGKTIYGWHISNLVIYDKPKELSEFYRECEETDCDDCPYLCFENTPNSYEDWCW